ncbi:proton channel OtopLc-like [Neocloeon triangulifer]|uniref:proton channel OtopLc-like n=1 Tax=Neocloeon triangulifer TaxID=2078957 RepID=UPI00286F1A0D|nr:proton channel OtopLc-like [Neocloeon triangulifer]
MAGKNNLALGVEAPDRSRGRPIFTAEQLAQIEERNRQARKEGDDALTKTLSVFYCKLLVVLGIAFPVTEALAPEIATNIAYEAFYLFLYGGSVAYVLYMYTTLTRDETEEETPLNPSVLTVPLRTPASESSASITRNRRRSSLFGIEIAPTWRQAPEAKIAGQEHVRYGSFYLRLGVAAFGIGSMIYSALEFGQFFELRKIDQCRNFFLALSPLCRIAFVLIQMLFIFANNKLMEIYRYKVIAKFGLMHMIATNLCEWLYVLIEETKSDIYNINRVTHHSRHDSTEDEDDSTFERSLWYEDDEFLLNRSLTSHECYKTNIMGNLLKETSPYLFPCTVEYSLLCAVILAVMWKNVCGRASKNPSRPRESGLNLIYSRSMNQFSVDCASAYKGLFVGIVLAVITIMSLIMFFELVYLPGFSYAAVIQINILECALFFSGTVASLILMVKIQRISISMNAGRFELEHILLVVTQSGVFLYSMFQVIGSIFSADFEELEIISVINIVLPIGAIVQSACQTLVLLDASRRRCDSPGQVKEKPGRQLVTFLLVTNLAIWALNRLKNGRMEFKPSQIDFYGHWSWAVITHVCVPLVVCYRFQSTVCLYEVWKRVYKLKPAII